MFETDLNLDAYCHQISTKATTANKHGSITETSQKCVTVAFPIQLFAIVQTVSSQFVATDVSVTGHPKSKIGENDLLVKVFNINESEFSFLCNSHNVTSSDRGSLSGPERHTDGLQ